MIPLPATSALFPYATLFRSKRAVVPANVPLPAVIVGVRIGAYATDDQYALAVLDQIVGSGRSSRLNRDRKSTRLNSSHANIPSAVFCLKKKLDESHLAGGRG